jgi:hypothetical protein
MIPRAGDPELDWARNEAFPGTVIGTKTQKRVSEFLGDTSWAASIVFYKLREVLILEFGDLIPEVSKLE